MKYVIISEQDYSNRFAGSWGSVILDHPNEVDVFLRNGDRKVVVEDDNRTRLTEEMDADQWYAWKEQNKHLYR